MRELADRDGIIPAYAGSTPVHVSPTMLKRDHPRVCGEHLRSSRALMVGEGSSPRMRGALIVITSIELVERIIPAYAGSTSTTTDGTSCRWDHPRVCGEHAFRIYATANRSGSSPRMRGALLFLKIDAHKAGIIPAYAGSTRGSAYRTQGQWDHPRVCGEHTTLRRTPVSPSGSSPRMRGALAILPRSLPLFGIIPAYAGSTLHEVHRSDSKAQFLYGCQGSANQ